MGRAFFVGLLFLAVSAPLYFACYQNSGTIRFELGSMDREYIADETYSFPPTRMSGPFRYEDNSVEVIEFYGRLTGRRAAFSLPYHALRSPLRLRIRCHRFGLRGIVALSVNGQAIDEYPFTERSYPWGGIQAVVPQDVAERGALQIELITTRGDPPHGHLREDLGLGIDWIEVEPMSRGALLLPRPYQWLTAYLFPLLGFVFFRLTGASNRSSLMVLSGTAASVCLLTSYSSSITSMALRHLWVVFPLGWILYRGLALRRLFPNLERRDRVFLSRLFVVAAVAHSALIFLPNHAPPDIWNHQPTVERLATLDISYETLHLRPNFRTPFGAPYPPFFYFLVYALSPLADETRFLLEFVPVLLGAFMVVMTFLTAQAIWQDSLIARLAALISAMEIALWHHIHRVHGPGVFGAFFVLGFVFFSPLTFPFSREGDGFSFLRSCPRRPCFPTPLHPFRHLFW